MSCFFYNYPITYSFIGFFFGFTVDKYHMEFDSKLKDWIKMYLIENWHRLFQKYFKSYRIFLGWLYGLFSNNYPATFHISASFWSYGIKMLHGIWYEIEGSNQKISYWNLAQVFQEYFKSYRIAFWMASWLDFEQLSCYLFVCRRLFAVTISITWNLLPKWRGESRYILLKLTTGYLKSISNKSE